MTLTDRCKKIEMILSDVDGVMTDGRLIFDNQGIETKQFHVRDGFGVRLWRRAGHKFGIITARSSHIVKLRATELELDVVRQGFEVKLPAAKETIAELGLVPEQVCYIGDDLTDLAVIRLVGLGVAVADAAAEVQEAATLVTRLGGGHGAVRETIETILKAQGRWAELIRKY